MGVKKNDKYEVCLDLFGPTLTGRWTLAAFGEIVGLARSNTEISSLMYVRAHTGVLRALNMLN